ncbi:hypothetical protein AAFF_G00158340 [Aldrovandia affinis]|uniref:Uncharacterized protein n=1 Tax=Aldrovandia affinis TaxID=143900 RepID=A0AAD7RN43_9TELE|nr:hypothetical protein AAFF_G00158340 [Aldrovandia affinis]
MSEGQEQPPAPSPQPADSHRALNKQRPAAGPVPLTHRWRGWRSGGGGGDETRRDAEIRTHLPVTRVRSRVVTSPELLSVREQHAVTTTRRRRGVLNADGSAGRRYRVRFSSDRIQPPTPNTEKDAGVAWRTETSPTETTGGRRSPEESLTKPKPCSYSADKQLRGAL